MTIMGGGPARRRARRFGATRSVPITRRPFVRRFASTTTTPRIGAEFDTAGCAWQDRWGGPP
jgi:hypothetical protein